MGATTFETFIAAGEDVREAFRDAVEQAAYDYGHAGYTGTIAEKHSYVIIQSEPMPYEDAADLAWDLIRRDDPRISDKWGPAGAIRTVTSSGTRGWLFFGWASE